MADFPQIQEEHPVLNAQPVSSGAESYEAFAKTLGAIAGVAEKQVVKIAEDKSNSMYLSSVANIDQLKLSTQELILTDPANAAKHVETLKDSIEKVQAVAYVNKEDRSKLKTYASKTYDGLELEAVKTTAKQAQIGLAYEHYKNWPFQLNALKQATFDPDPSKAETLQNSMLEHVKSLVLTGAITPLQGGAAIESMTAAIELSKEAHEFYKDVENHTPSKFHAVMANPFDKNKTTNINYPADENTKWNINYHSSDRTFQGAQNDIQSHLLPDIETFEKMTKLQRQQMRLEYNGVREADGLINSNAPITKVKSRLDDLEGKTDYKSTAERKALKSYVADLADGNSEKLMARTTLGGQIVRDYADKQAYLADQLKTTNPNNIKDIESIKSEMAKNKNDYVNKSIAFAEAHHWPVVHPIPKEDVAIVENGFKVGQTPGENATSAYNVFSQYSKQNQMYFADQLKNPRQKVVLQTISLGGKSVTNQEGIDFIAANQNRNYREIDLKTEDQISNDYLKNAINTQIPGAIKIIQAQNNPIDATVLNGQLIAAGVNYAQFISEKNGQFSMKKDGSIFGSINNIGDVTKFINRAYETMTGANYIVNKKQVDLEKVQVDHLAQYAIQKGNEYLRSHMSESNFIELNGRSPLTMTVTPTNIVVARDSNGNIAFRAPLTSDLIAHSTENIKKQKAEKESIVQKIFEKAKSLTKYLSPEEQLIHTGIGGDNAE